jgi:hypothetical protein
MKEYRDETRTDRTQDLNSKCPTPEIPFKSLDCTKLLKVV